ncbi:HNH endonuclease [Staphylococcus xylosus]
MSDRDVDVETKRFYNSKAWKVTREKVLERDNFECQECKKAGKFSGNRPDKHKSLDVDHIKELETHPELAHDLDNLITLCVSCHNKKHNRYQNRFFKKNKWADDEIW